MGRAPCCDKEGVKKGAWTAEEDKILVQYIKQHGHGRWRTLPKNAGLLRCGKSCRLRWTNYLRPNIKRGPFTLEEEASIIQLHGMLGNKWAAIACHLPGRTDNEIKNFWNTHLKRRLLSMGHNLSSSESSNLNFESSSTRHTIQWEHARVEAEARLSMESLLLNSSSTGKTYCDSFLQLWNSEVGESFRKIKGKDGSGPCESHIFQPSLSIKVESGTLDTVQARSARPSTSADSTHEQEEICKPNALAIAGSVSISTNEFSDYSDTTMDLLLDFPEGNDMEFSQGQTDSFSNFLDPKCE